MRYLIFLLLFVACAKPDRVQEAYRLKEQTIADLYKQVDCKRGAPVFLRAFKTEKQLEGDKQVPEGVYSITIFNPKSAFLLSLGLNYPNEADKKVANTDAMGGDIYIHGACVSIGCMAMTDDAIREIYLIALEAEEGGKQVDIHIFPFRMSDELLQKNARENPKWAAFWQELQPIYTFFETEHLVPAYTINTKGNYILYEP
jgi:murein L,D-transpeptidase YafK